MPEPAHTAPKAPGFFDGARSLVSGFGFLARTPATWPMALVPTLLLGALLGLAGYASFAWVLPTLNARLPQGSSDLGSGFWSIASYVLALGVFVLGALAAMTLTVPLSGPALERIVLARERSLGAPARPPLGFLAEIWCGLRAQIFVLGLSLPLLFTLWLVELFVAPAVVVTLPLKLLLTSLVMAWNLLDYPLTLRGMRMRERFELVKRHLGACLGFGVAFGALFWIPCGCQVVLLPVGAAAGTELVWKLLAADPSFLPELARPEPARATERT